MSRDHKNTEGHGRPVCGTCGGARWVGAPELMTDETPTPIMKPCPDCAMTAEPKCFASAGICIERQRETLSRLTAERDALRAEVERLREALRSVVPPAEDIEGGERWKRVAYAQCSGSCEGSARSILAIAEGALSSAPPAKPSAVEPVSEAYTLALAAWRGLGEEERAKMLGMFSWARAWTGDKAPGAALALLRAAAVKP